MIKWILILEFIIIAIIAATDRVQSAIINVCSSNPTKISIQSEINKLKGFNRNSWHKYYNINKVDHL